MAKKVDKLVCSECIEEFDPKNIFIAHVPDRDYTTVYCEKCLKELGIKEFKTYIKPRKPRAKKETTVKKPATKRVAKKTTPINKKRTTPINKKRTTAIDKNIINGKN